MDLVVGCDEAATAVVGHTFVAAVAAVHAEGDVWPTDGADLDGTAHTGTAGLILNLGRAGIKGDIRED